MALTPHSDLIPESTIVVFSPHFDDVLFMVGGYINELKKQSLMHTKNFHIIIIFSRSNYLAGTGAGNLDDSLDRIKLATGKRLLEDQDCNDELFGRFNYTYELLGEKECFTRGKTFADSEMEFPHGMYDDFDGEDQAIFDRMKARIEAWSEIDETALIFPTAIKEHIDHFITREAAIEVAKENNHNATFYFQEDKPYGGIADTTELLRLDSFVSANKLKGRTYTCDPESVIQLAFKHYVSQVEEIYKTGIRKRAQKLREEINALQPCDRLYVYPS